MTPIENTSGELSTDIRAYNRWHCRKREAGVTQRTLAPLFFFLLSDFPWLGERHVSVLDRGGIMKVARQVVMAAPPPLVICNPPGVYLQKRAITEYETGICFVGQVYDEVVGPFNSPGLVR
jgi:hypothetical protein